jgi:hypothetical protein
MSGQASMHDPPQRMTLFRTHATQQKLDPLPGHVSPPTTGATSEIQL